MDKFLEYMRTKHKRAQSLDRKMLIEGAIDYVEGLHVFFDVQVDDVPAYAAVAVASCVRRGFRGGNKHKSINVAIELYDRWVLLGCK